MILVSVQVAVVPTFEFCVEGCKLAALSLDRYGDAMQKVAVFGVVQVFFVDFGLFLRASGAFLLLRYLLLALLRFEASLLFALFGAQLLELAEGFVEGSLMSSLVAEVESERLGVVDFAGLRIETAGEEPLGALGEPMAFGHIGQENVFGRTCRPVFAGQGVLKTVELVLLLEGEKSEVAVVTSQTVDGVISR